MRCFYPLSWMFLSARTNVEMEAQCVQSLPTLIGGSTQWWQFAQQIAQQLVALQHLGQPWGVLIKQDFFPISQAHVHAKMSIHSGERKKKSKERSFPTCAWSLEEKSSKLNSPWFMSFSLPPLFKLKLYHGTCDLWSWVNAMLQLGRGNKSLQQVYIFKSPAC